MRVLKSLWRCDTAEPSQKHSGINKAPKGSSLAPAADPEVSLLFALSAVAGQDQDPDRASLALRMFSTPNSHSREMERAGKSEEEAKVKQTFGKLLNGPQHSWAQLSNGQLQGGAMGNCGEVQGMDFYRQCI